MGTMNDDLLTTKEAASVLKIHTSTLARWRSDRIGPKYTKIGSLVKYELGWILEYIESKTFIPPKEI